MKAITQFFEVQLDCSRRILLPQKERLLRFRQPPERLAALLYMRPVERLHILRLRIFLYFFNVTLPFAKLNLSRKQAYLTQEHQYAGLYKECTSFAAKFAQANGQVKPRIASPAIEAIIRRTLAKTQIPQPTSPNKRSTRRKLSKKA